MTNRERIIMLIDYWMDTDEDSGTLADRILEQVDTDEMESDKPRFKMDKQGNLTRI